ncbi:MAG: glycosyltransferase family 4 protein [archaeon]
MSKKSDINICFVSLSSISALQEGNDGYIGGAEIQQVELAKELNKRGYKIYFITYGKQRECIDGIKIIKAYEKDEARNLSNLRKFHLIWKKMDEVNADIYIYRAGSPAVTSLYCYLKRKILIRLIASDANVEGSSLHKKSLPRLVLHKIKNWFDIRLPTLIISQNSYQKHKLKDNFNRESLIIKNAFELPSINEPYKSKKDKKYCLWVGKIRSVKRPSLFLEIAKKLQNYKFIMIGGESSQEPSLYNKIKQKSKEIPNLDFKGYVPHSEIFDYYKNASVLVHTSKTEGFPNVFLEAWMHYTPVVSLNIDPDNIISKYNLGFHSRNMDNLLHDIKLLLNDENKRRKMGKNCRKYVEKNHNVKVIVDKYEKIIENY